MSDDELFDIIPELRVTGARICAGVLMYETSTGAFTCQCIAGPYVQAIVDYYAKSEHIRAIVAEQKLDQTIWGKEFHRLNAVNALRRLHAAIDSD